MASSKNFTEVLIGGKVFTLSGFESEDYLQKVSTYLNHKLDELGASDGYRKQNAETRSILLALNIADDYFKAKKQGTSLENDIEEKDKDMYGLSSDSLFHVTGNCIFCYMKNLRRDAHSHEEVDCCKLSTFHSGRC